MKSLFKVLASVAAIVAIAGCATPVPQVPPELQYRPPATAAEAGTIKGSQVDSAWADDFTVFIVGIDGKRVMTGRKGWNTPLPLAAGTRKILVEFNRGVFVANAVLDVPVAAGDALELKHATDAGVYQNNSYCDFWVVDMKSGKAVTDVVRGALRGGRSSSYVPVFIPTR